MSGLYKVDYGDLMHRAGFRWEISDEVAEVFAATEEHHMKTLFLSKELRPEDFEEEDLDKFPPAVRRYVLGLARRIDANARRGGPTISSILARGGKPG